MYRQNRNQSSVEKIVEMDMECRVQSVNYEDSQRTSLQPSVGEASSSNPEKGFNSHISEDEGVLLESIRRGILKKRRRRPLKDSFVPVPIWWGSQLTTQGTLLATSLLIQKGASMEFRQGAEPVLPRWTQLEIEILIAAKRVEHERNSGIARRDRMQSAESKWMEVQVACEQQGLFKHWKILKKKWDRTNNMLKKVWDFQKKIPSGVPGYFEMDNAEKKAHKLPSGLNFFEYEPMRQFVPENRNVAPAPEQLFDASANEGVTPPYTPTEEISPNGQGVTEGDDSQSEDGEGNDNSASVDFDNMGRRTKKGLKDVVEFHRNAMVDFMETMAEETKQRNRHENSMLEMERIKHFESQTLWAEQNFISREALEQNEALHKSSMAQQEANSIRLHSGLLEVSGAIRYLADGILKNQAW